MKTSLMPQIGQKWVFTHEYKYENNHYQEFWKILSIDPNDNVTIEFIGANYDHPYEDEGTVFTVPMMDFLIDNWSLVEA